MIAVDSNILVYAHRADSQFHEAALSAVRGLAEGEGPDHWRELANMAMAGAIGARVHDARIAALCHTAGVTELWSADRDFSRFDLNVANPLIGNI